MLNDKRSRCIEKKLPGCEPIYYAYDRSDQLIYTQDGNQRKSRQWTFTIPDELGRIALTGTCTGQVNIIEEKLVRAYYTGLSSVYGGYTVKYDDKAISSTALKVLTINYYDDYSFFKLFLSSKHKTELTYPEKSGYDTNYENAKGLLTGTRVYDLNGLTKSTYTVYYYDFRGNEIQVLSSNHLDGYEKNYYKRSFTRAVQEHLHEHTASGKEKITQIYRYEYDHAERLQKTHYKLNTANWVTLSENSYNELGQVESKKVHERMQNINYSYNIRNWLTGINSTQFRQNLNYAPHYNGNIYIVWIGLCLQGMKRKKAIAFLTIT